MKEYRALIAALLAAALLTPVGIYFPRILKAGSAWGEWGLEEIRSMIGYAPRGMEKDAGAWKAPLPDYGQRGQEQAPPGRRSVRYIASALIGIAVCAAAGWLLARRPPGRKGGDGNR